MLYVFVLYAVQRYSSALSNTTANRAHFNWGQKNSQLRAEEWGWMRKSEGSGQRSCDKEFPFDCLHRFLFHKYSFYFL